MKQCAIQIITEDPFKGGISGSRWISLAKDIDYINGTYRNISPFHQKSDWRVTKLDKYFFNKLFHGNSFATISKYDIIRNPTMEELIEISNAAKDVGIKINLKTGEYIGKL
jgi:hypothetical protein